MTQMETSSRNEALELCQQMGKTTMFDQDFNGGMSLPFHVAKKCALAALDFYINLCGRPEINDNRTGTIGYLTSIKEELLKLEP